MFKCLAFFRNQAFCEESSLFFVVILWYKDICESLKSKRVKGQACILALCFVI